MAVGESRAQGHADLLDALDRRLSGWDATFVHATAHVTEACIALGSDSQSPRYARRNNVPFSRDTTLSSLVRAAASRGGLGPRQRPLPASSWETQYEGGGWDYLYEIGEIAHYMAIVGYSLYGGKRPDVLDIGCGQGRLAELMDRSRFGRYLGVDLSANAIQQARQRAVVDGVAFEVADSNVWEPSDRFDVVVFNESLYYLEQPLEVLARSTRWLAGDGLVIISMFRGANVKRLWRQIDKTPTLRLQDRTMVRNYYRLTWDVAAYRVQR